MRATVTLADEAGTRSVQAEWAGPATLAQLAAAAGATLPPGGSIAVDGYHFGPDTTLRQAGVRHGSRVAVATRFPPSASATDPAAGPHVAVTLGPDAGRCFPVGATPDVRVGAGPECPIRLSDPSVAPHHLDLHLAAGAVTVEVLATSAPTLLGNTALAPGATVPLLPGARLTLGDTTVEYRPGGPADGVVHDTGEVREFRRPPRIRPAPFAAEVTWPMEPAKPQRQQLPLAAAVGPLIMGGVLYLLTKQVLTLLLVGVSPIMAVFSLVSSRRSGKAGYRKALAAYHEATGRAQAEQDRALAAEADHRYSLVEDPATVAASAIGPRHRLWERRQWDEDFLHLYLGAATQASVVRRQVEGIVPEPNAEPLWAPRLPVTLPVGDLGVLGIAGVPETSIKLASWLVGQAAVLSGPSDLRITVLAGEGPDAETRWGWTRWLPHVASPEPGGPAALGTTARTIDARLGELVNLIGVRQASLSGLAAGARGDWPRILVVVDPAYDIRRVPGADVLLQHGPAVGVFAICVESAEGYLPAECRAVLVADPSGHAMLRRSGHPDFGPITLPSVDAAWSEAVGRSLAPLHDPEQATAGGSIPSSARLVDLLDLDDLDASAVLRGWATARRATRGVMGVSLDGPFSLDLRVDGPHGLVAGTTGAGKSEFLQTVVASLAVANRHDGLNFLLVDYKGGSAFRDCARLPHTVGVVTDLDGHLVVRALVSLSAELKRREEVLAAGGAKDIDDYVERGEPAGPLPRLLIVIDEFAGLVAELPEFVSGLVGIAQRGRSLGIHMILATQRPSGVISPEIRANTNLRVALRVTSPAESADIIDTPDAAQISPTTPGRAYARTGASALTAFQAARVGGPAAPVATEQGPEVAVADAPWSAAGEVVQLAQRGPAGNVDPADTDLARLATVLIEAADRSGVPRQPQPWLPALPDTLSLDDLTAAADGGRGRRPGSLRPFAYGKVDLPAAQRQVTATFDLVGDRHLAIAGGPGSGRTTTLRTIAAELVGGSQPDEAWLYVIDCGGGELRRLEQFPHCGAVVGRNEPERALRLLTRLTDEMNQRLETLAANGFTDVNEQRAHTEWKDRIPYVVVMIDRWEGFRQAFDEIDNGRLSDLAQDLMREGGAAGFRVLVTGDRTVLSGKLATIIEDRLCLSLPDRNDFTYAGINPRDVPTEMPPGRAVRGADSAELQVAHLGASAAGADQTAGLNRLLREWREMTVRPLANRPFRLDTLPAEISSAEAARFVTHRPPGRYWALVGIGGDELAAVGVDLTEVGGYVVAGPRRSGRSNTLMVMAESLLAGGCRVLAFCPRMSPLRQLAGRPGVLGVFNGTEPDPQAVIDALNQAEGLPMTVLVDDAMMLHLTEIGDVLDTVAREGPEQGHMMVVAGIAEELLRPTRGFVYEVRQARTGYLLTPENTTDGELFATRLPRSAVFRGPVGRGIHIDGGHMRRLQTPKAADVTD